jgi:hypothetical protein
MIMRTFLGLLTVALTLSACATGSYDPQTVTDNARGGTLAQIMAECQEQTVAPEFDMIRSRVNMSMSGANPAPFMQGRSRAESGCRQEGLATSKMRRRSGRPADNGSS